MNSLSDTITDLTAAWISIILNLRNSRSGEDYLKKLSSVSVSEFLVGELMKHSSFLKLRSRRNSFRTVQIWGIWMKKYFVFLLLVLIITVYSTGCVAPQNSGSVTQNAQITPMPANDSQIITNKSGSDVPITQITPRPVNLTDKNEQIKTFEARIRKIQQTGTIPIIDVEYHWAAEMDIGKIIDNMDRNGVALTWLGPGEIQGSEESLRLNELYPDKFVPTTVHGDGPLWHGSDTNFLDKLDGEVRSGNYFAMGEFEARHYASGSQTSERDVHMPLDSKAFEIVFQASSDTGVPFLIHHEAEDAMLPELESMLTKYPKAKVVWCHFGRDSNPVTWSKFTTPDAPREFLNKYPNLYFDILQSPPGSKYKGYVEGIMYDTTQSLPTLKPEWKKVIEDFPDRFVLGSDINRERFGLYDDNMNRFRQIILSGMPKDIAEKIAYKNAWKLMTGENWKD
jgi:hypothetical protein